MVVAIITMITTVIHTVTIEEGVMIEEEEITIHMEETIEIVIPDIITAMTTAMVDTIIATIVDMAAVMITIVDVLEGAMITIEDKTDIVKRVITAQF